MTRHIITYEGINVCLAVMQEAYIPIFAPWPNRRIGIEGTMQRPPYTIESGKEFVRGLEKSKGVNEVFAVLARTRSGGYRYIGHTGVHGIRWPAGIASTGSVFGAPHSRGKGYGTEAKLLLLYHAFMVLGVRKMESSVKAFNAQSLGHLIKCGYSIVGRKKEHVLHEGAFVDEILLEAFRSDWQPIWQRYKETKTLPALTKAQRALVEKVTSE